ncbi:MAG TPA: HIT domain-containing protein [Candidatus Microsaccharimonas sp.]|jgi:diadenosine tetraphosphate (Ap4A) HIT family hydrolase
MLHYSKTRRQYVKLNKSDRGHRECAFCDDDTLKERVTQETETMLVIPNRVSYDLFEGRKVEDHLMVLPKRHLELMNDFTDQEQLELMKIIGEYEAKGYSMYARGSGSITRSVKHQHTHLIKLENKIPSFSLFLRKPYVLIHK